MNKSILIYSYYVTYEAEPLYRYPLAFFPRLKIFRTELLAHVCRYRVEPSRPMCREYN